MAKYEFSELFVGDLVVQPHQKQAGLGVVTSVKPSLQVAEILDYSGGETKIRLGVPGTVCKPVEVIGLLCVEQVIDSFEAPRAAKGGDVAYIGQLLTAAAEQGPAPHPTIVRQAA